VRISQGLGKQGRSLWLCRMGARLACSMNVKRIENKNRSDLQQSLKSGLMG